MKFLLDADMPRSSARVFAARGHDVLDARDAALKDISDESIAEFAKKENRIIVTRDLGFGNILSYPAGAHAGAIILRVPYFFNSVKINKVLAEFLERVTEDELKGSVIIVELGRYRIRR